MPKYIVSQPAIILCMDSTEQIACHDLCAHVAQNLRALVSGPQTGGPLQEQGFSLTENLHRKMVS